MFPSHQGLLRGLVATGLLAFLLCRNSGAAEHAYPHHFLSAGDLRLLVWLPDAADGYYRGIRFDGGGMVGQATWKGHTFFSELKRPHQPEVHDHGAGTAEEFGFELLPSYVTAKPGEGFVKIGVGVLQRLDDKPYAWNRAYPRLTTPPWTVVVNPTATVFSQELAFGAMAYHFSKRIAILAGGDGFTIEHELANRGSTAIVTDHYGHNMISIDGRALGPDYELRFPVPIQPHAPHRGLEFPEPTMARFTHMAAQKTVWVKLEGLPKTPEATSVTVSNRASGVAVTVSSDTAAERAVIYSEKDTICPEFFLAFEIAPGTSRRWTTTYRFTTLHP